MLGAVFFFDWYRDYVNPPEDEAMDIDPVAYDDDVEDMAKLRQYY